MLPCNRWLWTVIAASCMHNSLPFTITHALPQQGQSSIMTVGQRIQTQKQASLDPTVSSSWSTLEKYAILKGRNERDPKLPNFVNFTSSYFSQYLRDKQPQASEFLGLTRRLASGLANEYELADNVPITLFIPENRAIREVEQQYSTSKPRLADYYQLNHMVLGHRINITAISPDTFNIFNSTYSSAGYSNALYVVHFISKGSKSYGVTDVYVNCARIISGAQEYGNLVVYFVDSILQAPQASLVKPQYYRQCSGIASTNTAKEKSSAAASPSSSDA